MAATEAPNAPQAQDWELSKENFVPLKQGRSSKGLRDTTSELRKQLVDEQRRAFWEELASYKGEDPLEVWQRFIKWTQETFSAGGHKAELLPLLERCTRELQSLPQYQNDIRYLRIWVQYADCLPDPGDVFLFLKENEIGLEHALYYIAYATYLETRGNYARADQVYQQGINRLANPVDRLKAKFQEFQHRMARRIQRKAQEQQAGGGEPEHPGRQTLGTITSRRPARGGLPGPAGLKRKACASPPRAPGQENSAGGLAIFMDDEFQEGIPAASAPAALFAAGRSAAGPWSKLGSFEQSRKENTQRAGVWAGQKLKQQAAHSAPPAPALEILVDPEFEDAGTGEVEQQQTEPSLRQRLERGGKGATLDEALASDPLRMHREQPAAAAAQALSARPIVQPLQTAGQPDLKRRREELMAFDEEAMAAAGEERSFEELRASVWRARNTTHGTPAQQPASTRYPRPSPPSPKSKPAEPANPDLQPLAEAAAALQPAQAQHSPAATELVEEQPPAAQAVEPAPVALPVASPAAAASQPAAAEDQGFKVPAPRVRPSAHLVEPTMTISTRNAFAAINSMFQGSLPAEHSALPPNPYAEPTIQPGCYEPTMTLATRNAFAAINNMFKGSLPNEHGMLPPRAGPADPTVTINTRAAFEAINGMFGGGPFASAADNMGANSPGFVREDTVFIRQDTQILPPAASAHEALARAGSSGPVFVREDSMFDRQQQAASQAQQLVTHAAVQPVLDRGFSSGPVFAQPSPAPRGGFSIREDTMFVGTGMGRAPAAPSPAADGGFNIREDTMFVGACAAQDSQPAAGVHSPAAGGGFSIREDTIFVRVGSNNASQPAAAAPSPADGGFSIREDAMFIGGGPSQAPLEAAQLTSAAGGLGFNIREDTMFVGGSGAPTLPADDTDSLALPRLGLHVRTTPRADMPGAAGASAQVSKWGFAPGADDTLQLDLGDTQQLEGLLGKALLRDVAPLASRSNSSGGLAAHMADLQIVEDKENLIATGKPQAACSSRRGLQQGSGAFQSLLAPPGPDSEDAEAELLHHQGIAEEDSFEVAGSEETEPQPAQPAAARTVQVVDPFSSSFQPAMLSSLEPPVLQWPNVSACNATEEEVISSVLKGVKKGGASARLQLGGQECEVSRYVGAGAYATVYQASTADGEPVVLKLESPPCPWEWYICQVLQARVPPAARSGFIDPLGLVLGPGSSVLVAPYGAAGSLQDLVNTYLRQGQRPDEVVAMHFAMELLRLLGALHTSRIVHADVKPDNLLLQVTQVAGCDENAPPAVQLQLIDFGRSIDLELLPPGTLLQGDSGTDAFRCVEMREGAPWLYQADAYGVCGVVHCLLFGSYMEVDRVQDAEGQMSLRLRQGWKRYWAQEVWNAFFSTLLNHTSAEVPPPTQELLRRFEAHFQANPAAGRKLQTELRKLAAMCSS